MAAHEGNDPELARTRLLELLEGDDCEWEFSERARSQGKETLRWLHNRQSTDWEMVEYVIDLLKAKTELRCAPQGDPTWLDGDRLADDGREKRLRQASDLRTPHG